MKHTLRRLVAATAVAVTAVGPTAVPAHADHTVVGAHYGTFKWAGVEYLGPFRALFVLDSSGDATVGAALREFTTAYNADAQRRGLTGIVPWLTYVDNSRAIGACGPYTNIPGYSFSTVCTGNGGNYGSSVTWFGGAGTRSEMGYHSWSLIQRDYRDYNTTFANVAHELLHQLGVGHSHDCHNLMGGGEFGCRFQVGVKRYLTDHDWAALADYYRRIPMSQ